MTEPTLEDLPVSEGDTPPEDQVQGMATPDDLNGTEEEETD
ncbi:hypothetical protein [Streptomyces sp. NPDC060243]